MRLRLLVPFALLGSVAILAACGAGGGSSSPAVVPQSQGTTPTAAPATPTSASTTLPLNGTAGSPQSIALPSAGGYSGTMIVTLAAPASNVTADIWLGASPPPGVPAPADANQPLVFVGLSTSSNVTLTGVPAFSFTVPSAALQSIARTPQSAFTLLLNFFDAGNPKLGYQSGGTCTLGGLTVTCNGGSALFDPIVQLLDVFELERQNLPASTPTPSPSETGANGNTVITVPTPAPVLCTPAALAVGVGETVAITCTAQQYIGSFAWTVADPTIASVQQTNPQSFTLFNVTGLKAGTTTLSLHSQPGGTGSVTITVSP